MVVFSSFTYRLYRRGISLKFSRCFHFSEIETFSWLKKYRKKAGHVSALGSSDMLASLYCPGLIRTTKVPAAMTCGFSNSSVIFAIPFPFTLVHNRVMTQWTRIILNDHSEPTLVSSMLLLSSISIAKFSFECVVADLFSQHVTRSTT